MSVYLISYDLNQPGQKYTNLHDAIKSQGTWWHYVDSTWLVSTNRTAKEVSNALLKEIDRNDNLLVIRVTDEFAGWLPKKAWDWIHRHVTEKARAA